MKLSVQFIIMLFCACLAISGCVTMRYPGAYKVAGTEVKEFKGLDDERALKLIALIYNVKHEDWEDGIARSIALQEYLGLLAKRKSPVVKNSGIFEISYNKVDLTKWKDEDLMKLYDSLEPKTERYYIDAAPEMTDAQNAERLARLTAVGAIVTETKKRNNTRNAAAIAAQVLVGVLTAVMAML